MKNKIINENRCRYCNQIVQGITICGCGGRQRDMTIWVQNTHRDRRMDKKRGGNKRGKN